MLREKLDRTGAWKLEAGLVAINLGEFLRLPDAAWQHYSSIPTSTSARTLLTRIARKYFGAIAKHQGKPKKEVDRVVAEIVTDAHWAVRAQAAFDLCSRYADALSEFAKAFHLDGDHSDALGRQFDAMLLIEACEGARFWSQRGDSGYKFREQLTKLRKARERERITKSILKAANIIKAYRYALAAPIAAALMQARLFEPSPGVQSSEGSTAFPGRSSTAERFEKALRVLPDTIDHLVQVSLKKFEEPDPDPTKRTPQKTTFVKAGNIQFLGYRQGKPDAQRTGLAAELAMLLAEMSCKPAGTLRPVMHFHNLAETGARPRYEVVSAFVLAALGGPYSASAAAKAVKPLIEDRHRLVLHDWE